MKRTAASDGHKGPAHGRAIARLVAIFVVIGILGASSAGYAADGTLALQLAQASPGDTLRVTVAPTISGRASVEMKCSACPTVGRKMSPRGSFGFGSIAKRIE